MRFALLLAAAVVSRADTITVPIVDQGPLVVNYDANFYGSPGYFQQDVLAWDAFDPALGTLNSLTIAFEISDTPCEHYQTAETQQYVTLNYNQTATAEVLGFSTSITLYASEQVRSIMCHTCGTGIPYDLKGGGTLSGSALSLVDVVGATDYTLSDELTVGSEPEGYPDAWMANNFFGNGGAPLFTGTVTYDFTPVPEPGLGVATLLALATTLVCLHRLFGKERRDTSAAD